jgi:hypothetical protein
MPKRKRRKKYCPRCKEEISMSVVRTAEDDPDLYWLICPSCDSTYALTRKQYHREKRPDISAINPDDAHEYDTGQTYSVGETLYHPSFDEIGLVVDKGAPPTSNCSGRVVVSFIESGPKTLIEGLESD